ncbi:MAG: polysaccharide deacetylase family protein [Peptococcaceae bacterium]|nr:polysaccharide deacetylase family protein [Peptococcaceae bacterium]MDH7524094.1 polysaccharide deacetylase family protein [Peptococcaceae bacterium]
MHIYYLTRRTLSCFAAAVIVLALAAATNMLSQNPDRKASVPAVNPVYIGNTQEKAVAIMVNVDWGEKVLPAMIKMFKNKRIEATFFITGRFAQKNQELVQEIARSGFEIGNHGYSHPHPNSMGLEQNKNEIIKTEQVLTGLNVKVSKIFAPPYGEHQQHVLKAANSLGYKTIMWTIDTLDWQDPSPEAIIKKVLSKADNGALVLTHPKECTVAALPAVIDALRAQDFSFKTVTGILQ